MNNDEWLRVLNVGLNAKQVKLGLTRAWSDLIRTLSKWGLICVSTGTVAVCVIVFIIWMTGG